MGEASYLGLLRSGELAARAAAAREALAACNLCGHHCGVNRIAGERGRCQTGLQAVVSSYGPHLGEEAPLVGRHGSGTIFFTHCNLACVFCQNWEISHAGEGTSVPNEQIAGLMLALQRRGCHNINFVTPSHVIAQILSALCIAAEEGLTVPLVYNCGGYESLEALRLLDGVIDIYMPDAKYADAEVAERLSGIADYPETLKAALKEMHRQVDDLTMDDRGIAERGLLIRHLVLPNGLAGTRELMAFIAQELSADTYINLMGQYRPCHSAYRHAEIDRRPTGQEMREAFEAAEEAGLHRFD